MICTTSYPFYVKKLSLRYPCGTQNSNKMSQALSDPDRLSPIVKISQDEYKNLVTIAHQYQTLCSNLLNGGVTQEALKLLSLQTSANSDPNESIHASYAPTTSAGRPENGLVPTDIGHVLRSCQDSSLSAGRWERAQALGKGEDSSDDSEFDMLDQPKGPIFDEAPRLEFERVATRTVQLCNLPQGTTLADITSVVRGGLLLDVFLRTRDNTVALSFLHSRDAQAFYDHVHNNGLHINGSKVEVRWSDRQFVLGGHTAHKIGLGACRNLVVRYCNPNHTERKIVDDLEHIHNLVVIHVEFIGGHCFISTNSVNAAMFARTCMMSRLKYKGSRIEWGVDECAQPLHKLPNARSRQAEATSKQTQTYATNRFELLCLEE